MVEVVDVVEEEVAQEEVAEADLEIVVDLEIVEEIVEDLEEIVEDLEVANLAEAKSSKLHNILDFIKLP